MRLKKKYRTKILKIGGSRYVRIPPLWGQDEREVIVFEGDNVLLITKQDSPSYFVMNEESFKWLQNRLQSEFDKADKLDVVEVERIKKEGTVFGTYYGGYRDGIREAFELLRATFDTWFDNDLGIGGRSREQGNKQ